MRYYIGRIGNHGDCWFVGDNETRCVVVHSCYEQGARIDCDILNRASEREHISHVFGYLFIEHPTPYHYIPDVPIPLAKFVSTYRKGR